MKSASDKRPLLDEIHRSLEALFAEGTPFAAVSMDFQSGNRAVEREASALCRTQVFALLAPWRGEGGGVIHATSHAAGRALVVGAVPPRRSCAGVGVDIERLDRNIEQSVLKRVSTPSELALGVPGVLHWCLKEAAWKAGDRSEGRVVAQYVVRGWDASTGMATLECVAEAVEPRFARFQALAGHAEGFAFAVAIAVGKVQA